MSQSRKVTRDPPERLKAVQLPAAATRHIFGRAKVSIATPDELPALTQQERRGIVAATQIHFTETDWGVVDSVRRNTVAQFYAIRDGVECDDLIARLTAMQEAALLLLNNGPSNRKEIIDAAETLAWQRIEQVEGPPFGRDEIYPQIAILARRSKLALEHAIKEKEGEANHRASHKTIFIEGLARVFESKGLKVSKTKPKEHCNPGPPSEFAAFVGAVAQTIPNEIGGLPRDATTAANQAAIAEAVRKSGR